MTADLNRRGFLKALLGVAAVALAPHTLLTAAPQTAPVRSVVTHHTYALGFRVTQEMMEDDHFVLPKMPNDLRDAARAHRDNLAWAVINNSFGGAA